jgi:hypothetical protein
MPRSYDGRRSLGRSFCIAITGAALFATCPRCCTSQPSGIHDGEIKALLVASYALLKPQPKPAKRSAPVKRARL